MDVGWYEEQIETRSSEWREKREETEPRDKR